MPTELSGDIALTRLREHQTALSLPGGNWSIWPWAVLRMAGFPASLVTSLAGERAAAAADAYTAKRLEVIEVRKAILQQLGVALRAGTGGTLAELRAERRHIRSGNIATDRGSDRERLLAKTIAAREQSYRELVKQRDQDWDACATQLARLLSNDSFKEAALWQNPDAALVIDRTLHETTTRTKDARSAIQFVARLAQRYALKNDTIGFFGPLSWAVIGDARLAISIANSAAPVRRGPVYFEGWCIDALIDALNSDPALRPWLSPRRHLSLWLAQADVYDARGSVVSLTPDERQILDLCDGIRTAREVADAVLSEKQRQSTSDDEIFAAIGRLADAGFVVWRLEVHAQVQPEVALRERLERIGNQNLRQRCVELLTQLEDARNAVAKAAGDSASLESQLRNLGVTFTKLTGHAPSRRHGQTYAARTLVYQDCHRDMGIVLGAPLFERLGPSLSIVLDAARWACGALATQFRRYLRDCYAAFAANSPQTCSGHDFYEFVIAQPETGRVPLLVAVQRDFQDRWQSVLQISNEPTRIIRSVLQIRERATAAFAQPETLWSRAEYFSPDVMVEAASLDAICRGDCQFVLGEVHSTNTMIWSALLSQHPEPEWFAEQLSRESDGRAPQRIMYQLPRDEWLARRNPMAMPAHAYRYEFRHELPSLPKCEGLPAAMFTVVDDGKTIRMRARDHSCDFDAIELFGNDLCVYANKTVSMPLAGAPHLPRLVIGTLVVSREKWFATPADMPFLNHQLDAASQYAAVRSWASRLGMPKSVFYKSPNEPKPCYLDFDNPVYSTAFIKVAQRLEGNQRMRIEEMLPGVNDLWLAEDAAERRTSEFRFVVRHNANPCGL